MAPLEEEKELFEAQADDKINRRGAEGTVEEEGGVQVQGELQA